VEFSTSPTFSTIAQATTIALAPGDDVTTTYTPTIAQVGATLYVRVTPYNAVALGGLAGSPATAECHLWVMATAQGEIATGADGVCDAVADGPLGTNSFRYAWSTSAQPDDGTVATSGAIYTGSRHFVLTAFVALAFGEHVYLTLVPFTGASAAGTPLPAIHLHGARESFSASKTVTYSRVAWNYLGSHGFTTDAANGILNAQLPAGTIRDNCGIALVLPVGVILTSATFDVAWNTATNPLFGFTVSVLANGGTVNFGSPTAGGGAQTIVLSLGSTTLSSGAVFCQNRWSNPFGPADADAEQAALGDISITYTMPDPAKTV
jgi:hypothetical protein